MMWLEVAIHGEDVGKHEDVYVTPTSSLVHLNASAYDAYSTAKRVVIRRLTGLTISHQLRRNLFQSIESISPPSPRISLGPPHLFQNLEYLATIRERSCLVSWLRMRDRGMRWLSCRDGWRTRWTMRIRAGGYSLRGCRHLETSHSKS